MNPVVSIHDVPDDIVFTVFARLPADDLLRFTCVSRSINALIRSSTFIVTHLCNQIQNKNSINNCDYVVRMPNIDYEGQESCSLRRQTNLPSRKYNLYFPFRLYDLIGTCEGLVCFIKDFDLYIWNPFVGSVKKVPPSGSVHKNNDVDYKFDFVERSCDYRIIKVFIGGDGFGHESINLEIYSLATNSWRRIDYKCSDWQFDSEVHLFFKRLSYWWGSSDSTMAVFRYDLDQETFIEDTNMIPSGNRLLSIARAYEWDDDGLFKKCQDECIVVIDQHSGRLIRVDTYDYLVPVKKCTLMLLDEKLRQDLILREAL